MNYTTSHNDVFRMSVTSLTSLVTGKQYKPVRKSTLTLDLVQAARDGQLDQVQQHIHRIGKDKKKFNCKDQDQTTALHYAVRYGHLKIVELLILNGANVNVQGENGATPLHYAARYVSKLSPRANDASPLPVRPPPPKRSSSSNSIRRISSAFSNIKMPKSISMPQIVDLAIKKRLKRGLSGDGFKMSMKRSSTAEANLNMLASGSGNQKSILKRSPDDEEGRRMPKSISMPQIADLAIKKRLKRGSSGDGFKMSMKRSSTAEANLNMLANGSGDQKNILKKSPDEEEGRRMPKSISMPQITDLAIKKRLKRGLSGDGFKMSMKRSSTAEANLNMLASGSGKQKSILKRSPDDEEGRRMPKSISMPQIADLAIKKRLKRGLSGDGFKMSMKQSSTAEANLNMLASGSGIQKSILKKFPCDEMGRKMPQSIPDFSSVVKAEINQNKVTKPLTSMQEVPSAESLKKKQRSILELSDTVEEERKASIFKDKEKDEGEKREKPSIKPLTSRDKFDEHNSSKYRYDGEENLPPLQKVLGISKNRDSEMNACIKSVDALILQAVSQESRSRSNAAEKISRSKTMLLDDNEIDTSGMLSFNSRDDLDRRSERISGSSMENLDDHTVELFNSTKKEEEADEENEDVFLDNSSAEISFSPKGSHRLSVQFHRGSIGDDCFLNPRLGVNNLGYKSSDENLSNESVIRYLLEHRANVNAQDSFGSTPLHYAAMRGNSAAVRQLLAQHGINLEAKDRVKMTALQIAANHGSIDVCKQLLRAGCDVRNGQMTALHFAAMEGHLDIVELLNKHTENMLCLNEAKIIMDRDTAMHLAVENGHYEIVKYLIEKGANVNFVKENMITPLHLACRYGQLDIVKVLVEHKADIESKNMMLASPLHTAAMFNRVNVAKFLLQKGAEIDSFDKDKETPLILAVRKGNLETVKFLLEKNADVTITDTKDKTCLFVAAEENCIDVFKVLLESQKASQLIEQFDKNDNTPLHIAAKKGHVEIVEMLVKADALVHVKNDSNLTPLHLAAQNGRSKIVEIFLSQESLNVVNDEDDSSNTPLHLAALEGHVKVVAILLNSGAAVDARNAMLWSPLDCAASRGWTKCAECLLDADSLIEPTDKYKTTPLHHASCAGHVGMIKLLLSRKADISRKDHLGFNCLDWAIDNKQKESAIAILESDRWKLAMRHCTIEGNRIETPMRKMIKNLPEVAEIVFNKCITDNGLPKEHIDFQVKCNYEYLEDTFSEWGPSREFTWAPKTPIIEVAPDSSVSMTPSVGGKNQSLLSKIKNVSKSNYFKKAEFKIDHPLKYMMQNEQTKLLSHHLVTNLLRYKWRTFGRFVYYTHLLIYLIYLLFVTGFGLTIVADDYGYNCSTEFDNATRKMAKVCECVLNPNSTYYMAPSETARLVFESHGRPIILLVAISLFCIEVSKLLTNLSNYLNVHCYLKLASYSCSVLYVLSSYDFPDGSAMEVMEDFRCLYPHKSNGAVTIWMAWINLVLFIRVFPKLGIYVMMMSEIMKTFFQCFTVVILFFVGFGLGFHMLLHNQKPISYVTPQRAIMKSFMGMLGEFSFDKIFNGVFRPVPVAWALYVVFIIINCIILMNMLVGLAVDDIKGVQEQALLKKIGMQVDHTLDVEKTLPMSLQRKFMKLEETICVNQVRRLHLWSSFWKERENKGQINCCTNHSEALVKHQYDLAESVRLLKNKVAELEASNNRKEAIIEYLIKAKGISLEEFN